MASAKSFCAARAARPVVDAAERGVERAPERRAAQTEATTARIPAVVEDCCSRRMPARQRDSAALGKIRCRSASTDTSRSPDFSRRPVTKSATSASAKSESSRL